MHLLFLFDKSVVLYDVMWYLIYGGDNMKTLYWLKLIRSEKGLTQQELADKIGISREQINHYENGRVKPQALNKYKIAQALGFDVKLWEQNKEEN